ncbi:hypothetical protein Dimus_013479 [Dionaea muscipula]
MKDNGLSNVMELIKRQKSENLFKRRGLVHVDSVKEFYARMTVIHLKKKDVVKTSVKGVAIEFDHLKLASILGILGNNGICEYIKDVWEESKYTKPLQITRKFANDETLTAARRVKSGEMKPFQRFIHFLVMKNVVPRFGKRDTSSFMDLTYMDHLMTRRLVNLPIVMMRHMSYVISMKDHELPYEDWLTMVFEEFGVPLVDKKGEEPKKFGKRDTSSFMDLTYMDHLMTRRLVNLPRVMMRHMSYVISMKDHELPYEDWLTMVFEEFGVPLVDKKGEEPKKYDFFEETFLTMCKLTRENGVWWIGSGENRRRDDVMEAPAEEVHEEEETQNTKFDWEEVVDEAAVEGESGSGEKFFDAEDEVQDSPDVN